MLSWNGVGGLDISLFSTATVKCAEIIQQLMVRDVIGSGCVYSNVFYPLDLLRLNLQSN